MFSYIGIAELNTTFIHIIIIKSSQYTTRLIKIIHITGKS
jgi:hypothetical protein